MLKLENHITKIWPKELHVIAERALQDDVRNKQIIKNINKRLISIIWSNCFAYAFLLVIFLISFEMALFVQMICVVAFSLLTYLLPKIEIEQFLNNIVFPLNRGNKVAGNIEAVEKIVPKVLVHTGWRVKYSINGSHYPSIGKISLGKYDCSSVYQKGDSIIVFVDEKNRRYSCPGLHELIEQFKFLK